MPSVTCSVCPRACRCQAVRAQGENRTMAARSREGSSASAIVSTHTSPVNRSGGALAERLFSRSFRVPRSLYFVSSSTMALSWVSAPIPLGHPA